jgi:hypothetical protein
MFDRWLHLAFAFARRLYLPLCQWKWNYFALIGGYICFWEGSRSRSSRKINFEYERAVDCTVDDECTSIFNKCWWRSDCAN